MEYIVTPAQSSDGFVRLQGRTRARRCAQRIHEQLDVEGAAPVPLRPAELPWRALRVHRSVDPVLAVRLT